MIAVGDAASMPISARPRSRGTAARHGVRDVAPMLVGLVPFGLVVGVAVAASGPVAARWSATFLVFAGSAQLVVLDLLDHGAPVALVVAAGLAANARLIAYSASLAPRWSGEPRWFRLIGAAALVDPTWALAQRDLDAADGANHRWYYAGAAVTLTVGWGLLVTIGALGGSRVAGVVGSVGALAVAAPLCMTAVVAPQLVRRTAVAVAATAAAVATLTAAWPAGSGMLAAIGAATAVGALIPDRTIATDRFPATVGPSPVGPGGDGPRQGGPPQGGPPQGSRLDGLRPGRPEEHRPGAER